MRGGENEGSSGVHANFERMQPSYVRRSCLNHLAWTVGRQGLEEIEMSLVERLCTYLNSAKSTTWWHLQCIAVHPPEDGGLGLFREGSREFREIFSAMLGTIVEERLESVMNFLRFLRGGEAALAALAAKDVATRSL